MPADLRWHVALVTSDGEDTAQYYRINVFHESFHKQSLPIRQATKMLSALALRRLAVTASRARTLHSTARAFVRVGDTIPNVELVEKSPGNKVNLSKEIKGKALIIGVPAAFSK